MEKFQGYLECDVLIKVVFVAWEAYLKKVLGLDRMQRRGIVSLSKKVGE